MGSESIAHEFSKIQLVGQKYQDKTTIVLVFKASTFHY